MVEFLTTPTNLFNITVTHLRLSRSKDRGGSTVKNYNSIGTFACRIQGPPGEERELNETGHRSFYTATMYCGPDEVFKEDDRIQQSASSVWDIEGFDNVDSENIFQQVNLKRSV